MQLRSWMIPAEACPGTFVTLKGACGKTTTTDIAEKALYTLQTFYGVPLLHREHLHLLRGKFVKIIGKPHNLYMEHL